MKKKRKIKLNTSSGEISSPDAVDEKYYKIKSGFKYVYIVAFFVLLSGFFHPLINGISPINVVIGTFILIVGLIGGIFLYRATISENNTPVLLGAGFGLVVLSLASIFALITS